MLFTVEKNLRIVLIIFYLKEKLTFFSPLRFFQGNICYWSAGQSLLAVRSWTFRVRVRNQFIPVCTWMVNVSLRVSGLLLSHSSPALLPFPCSFSFSPPLSVSVGGESLAVAQNTYAVNWFKGKELNLVFGLQLSMARLVRTPEFISCTSISLPSLFISKWRLLTWCVSGCVQSVYVYDAEAFRSWWCPALLIIIFCFLNEVTRKYMYVCG